METGVKTGLLMNFTVTNLKSGIKRFILLLRALRVLRGETILYLCESLITSRFLFSYPLLSASPAQAGETTKSQKNGVAQQLPLRRTSRTRTGEGFGCSFLQSGVSFG